MIRLDTEDSSRLLRHMEEDKPNITAQEALRRGRELLKEYDEKGYATAKYDYPND